jgi:Nuclear pore assembly and biogenesis
MDFLQSAQTLLRRTQDLRNSFHTSGPSDTISAIADQIVDFLLPSSSSSTSSTLNTFQRNYITPYILSPLQSLFTTTSSSSSSNSSTNSSGMPDLLSILALVVIAFISFKVLDYIRRVVMWWIMLALKLCLLVVALQVGWYVSQYGWEKTLQDAGWAWGLLEGFIGETEAQIGGSTRSRTTTSGTRGRGKQQAPLGNTRGQRGRWT